MSEKLIDAEAFEKHIMGSQVFSQYFKELVQSLIWGENTVDAVRVVRCKDCLYYQDNNGGYPHPDCRWGHEETPDEDDYCSFGEKMDEEDEK